MRVTSCVRFAFILAVLFTRTIALSNMTDAEEKTTVAPAAAPALVSILKDTVSVRTQEFLLLHDLDDIAGCRDVYLQARTELLEYFAMLRTLDPLIDYAAARNNVPWAAEDPAVLRAGTGTAARRSTRRGLAASREKNSTR